MKTFFLTSVWSATWINARSHQRISDERILPGAFVRNIEKHRVGSDECGENIYSWTAEISQDKRLWYAYQSRRAPTVGIVS